MGRGGGVEGAGGGKGGGARGWGKGEGDCISRTLLVRLTSNFDTRCGSINTFRIQKMGLAPVTLVESPVTPGKKSVNQLYIEKYWSV